MKLNRINVFFAILLLVFSITACAQKEGNGVDKGGDSGQASGDASQGTSQGQDSGDQGGQSATDKDQSQDQVKNQSQDQIINQTHQPQQNQTQDKIINKTQDQLANKTQDKLMNQTQDQLINKTQDQLMNKTQDQIKNQTFDQTRNQTQDMIRNVSDADLLQLREKIRNMSMELNQSALQLNVDEQEVYLSQSRARLAAHSLVEMEDITGTPGGSISQIAQEYNESLQNTIQAEERITERSGFTRFLFGGDENAAKEIEREVEQNRQRIEALNQLINTCECDAEIKAMLEEHLRLMEEEQNRLTALAQKELDDRGLLGWLWK